MEPDRAETQDKLPRRPASCVSAIQSPPLTHLRPMLTRYQDILNQEAARCLRLRSRPGRHSRLHLRGRDRSRHAHHQGRSFLRPPRLLRPRHVKLASQPCPETTSGNQRGTCEQKAQSGPAAAGEHTGGISPFTRPADSDHRVGAQWGQQCGTRRNSWHTS